jgi:hypothetical protein
MAKVRILKSGSGIFEYIFFCPGCQCGHGFRTKSFIPPMVLNDNEKEWIKSVWDFDGNLEKPTLSPSYLIPGTPGADGLQGSGRCHSYVIDGQIQFLSDCDHELKGKTVDLEEF